jgi:glycosyltransferase involved in cell wall biosynthesis
VHVINHLVTGGAESMLVRLAGALRGEFEQSVICILDRGPLADRLEAQDIPVRALGASARLPNPLVMAPLIRALRRAEPDIVQTWLYHSDLLGGVAARMCGIGNVIWNLRGGEVAWSEVHPLTRAAIRIGAWLSARIPQRIVCCAESVREAHGKLGYDLSRAVCIPNGVELGRFAPDAAGRKRVREELGIPRDAAVIGLFARLSAQKDHGTFFAAAGRLRARRPEVHFLLAGPGIERDNPKLESLLQGLSLDERFHLLGERRDIASLTAALDVATSSSAWGEGFPNVIAEAMACGVACVSTDSGDAAAIVGDTGIVVPPRDPDALASAWSRLLALPDAERRQLGARARQRIETQFDFQFAVRQYADLYRSLVGRKPCAA